MNPRMLRGLNATPSSDGASQCPEPAVFDAVSFLLGIVFVVITAMAGITGWIFYQRTRQRIGADKVWRVDFTEVRRVKLIGRGKYGKVFKAIWREKTVAIKMLNDTRKVKREVLQEFVREVEIMSDLRHPNVLLFMGACVEQPNLAIITAFMDKGSLWDLVHTGTPETFFNQWNNRVRVLIDLALGMNYLHNFPTPIVHRDLKTPNVLMDSNFNVYVSDFGLTKIKDAIEDKNAIGNPLWNAPELYLAQPITEKIDVYSFAIIAWELVTMEIPFHGIPLQGLPVMVATKATRPELPPDLPDLMRDLICEMWHADVAKRPSFAKVLNRLRACKIDKDSVALGLQTQQDQYLPRIFSIKGSRGKKPLRTEDIENIEGIRLRRKSLSGIYEEEGDQNEPEMELVVDWDVNIAEDVQLGRKLGEGMSAEVFLADFRGKQAAVKKIFFSNPDDEAIVDFYKETRLMKSLQGPDVVRMLGCAVARPFAYILTEYMNNGSMYDMYKHTPAYQSSNTPPFFKRLKMGVDVCHGVEYLHSHDVVHRDLKSPNVMVASTLNPGAESKSRALERRPSHGAHLGTDVTFQAKVGDFGLSRVSDTTKTMTICGSPLWTAPEMLMSVRYNEKVDVYSFGVILWETHQWDEPYPGLMVFEIVKGVVEHNERPEIKSDMDKEMVSIMQDCWKAKPDDRPTMAELRPRVEAYFARIDEGPREHTVAKKENHTEQATPTAGKTKQKDGGLKQVLSSASAGIRGALRRSDSKPKMAN